MHVENIRSRYHRRTVQTLEPSAQFQFQYLVDYSPVMVNCGNEFDRKVAAIVTRDCSTCLRSSAELNIDSVSNSCSTCRKVRVGEINKFSAANNMDPGVVPVELQNLSYIEQMLIAQVHPVVSLYRVKGNQYKYGGNVISFRQNIEEYIGILPVLPSTLKSTILFSKETPSGLVEFRADRERIRRALTWLQLNNQYYSNIVISS